jgi:arabinan endo-1,5-alpha-L-arabinosidase
MLFTESLTICGGNSYPEMDKPSDKEEGKYTNPVIPLSLPDPTIIKAGDGYFYVYATEDMAYIPIFRSKDLVNGKQVGAAFTEETRPSWEPKGGVWAPDINYINGQYVLYYSMSVWGCIEMCGIGVAVSGNPVFN